MASMTTPKVTTLSCIGWCGQSTMIAGVKKHSDDLRAEYALNETLGSMDRHDEQTDDGVPKTEKNTKVIERTGLRWGRNGIHKVYRRRPYMNKSNKKKGNFRNAMMIVTEAGDDDAEAGDDIATTDDIEAALRPSANLFTNGKITSAGHRSVDGFHKYADMVLGGLFNGAKVDRARTVCILIRSDACLDVPPRGIDMQALRVQLDRKLGDHATVSENTVKVCVTIQYPVIAGVGGGRPFGPSIHLYADGHVQVVTKSEKDSDRMWKVVRSTVATTVAAVCR